MPGDIAEDMKTLPVFIRRYNDSKSFADMIHGYRELTGGYNYAIENLTELPADERFMRISSVIIALLNIIFSEIYDRPFVFEIPNSLSIATK